MPKNGVLINTARKEVIDEESLAEAFAERAAFRYVADVKPDNAAELQEKYGVPVLAVNAAQLKAEDIKKILEQMLYQFPLKELRFFFPGWVETLEQGHWLKQGLTAAL